MISPISSNRIESFTPSANAPTTNATVPDLLTSPTHALACSGDLGSALAAMLLEASDASRKAARISREAASRAEDAAFTQRIHHMREAADQRLTSGIVGGATTFASGMAQIGGSVDALSSGSTSCAAIARATGAAEEGSGKAVAAFFDHGASASDAAAASDERAMHAASRRIEASDDREKEAKELAQRTLSNLQGLLAAKAEAQKAAIFRA